MSSLRNAVKRKTHKERSQPAARRQYGLLEKKKDYVLRAKDYHKKEDALQALRRKAEDRNPDEFYFAMEHQRTVDGVHDGRLTQANKYSQEELRLMKTQDVKYLSLKAQTEAKKAERLRQNLHFVGAPVQNQHTVFVEDEAAARAFSAEQHFDTPAELLSRTFNRPRTAQLESPAVLSAPADRAQRLASRMDRKRAAAYKELLQREERQQKLGGLAAKLALKRELMGKGHMRKLKAEETGLEQTVYRWKRERKR